MVFTIFGANSADDKLMIFYLFIYFFFFFQKTEFDISCTLSLCEIVKTEVILHIIEYKETVCMKYQTLFSEEKIRRMFQNVVC